VNLRRAAPAGLLALLLSLTADPALADTVIQIPLDSLLTGRAVTTLSAKTIVPWTVGVDQNDGFVTAAAEAFLGQTGAALPDDGDFPADAQHPEIVLHFSNDAPGASPQNAYVNNVGSLAIAIPSTNYSKIFLVMTDAANGATPDGSPLTVTLSYGDGTSTPLNLTWPDYGTGVLPSDPPGLFNLASGMHKWNKDDVSVDTPTHALTGIELDADESRILSAVRVDKLDTGKVLVLWGVTAIATGAIEAGASPQVADASASADADEDATSDADDATPAMSAASTGESSGSDEGGRAMQSAAGTAARSTGSTGASATEGSGSTAATARSTGSGCGVAASARQSPLASVILVVTTWLGRRRARRRQARR
jgi:hypothetical protein